MAARLNMRRFVFALCVTCVAVIPLLFQNCAEPLDESRDALSVAESLPFSFDVNVDHLAYMSCSFVPNNAPSDAYYTFKIGAYNNGNGLKLNDDFFYFTRNLLNGDKIAALKASPTNSGVFVSGAVRETARVAFVSSSPGENSLGTFVGSLTSDAIAGALVNQSQSARLNVFSSAVGPVKLEQTLHFKFNEATASAMRLQLQSEEVQVTVGFGQMGQQIGYPLSPNQSLGQMYGLGYRMGFALGNGQNSPYLSGDARVLTNLREFDLLNGQQTSSQWDCNPNWRFMIVRPVDLGVRALCENTGTEPTPANAAEQEMLTALRAVLPASIWGVNLQRRCLVPKSGIDLCYGSDPQNLLQINYSGGTCDPTQRTCPHFLSICKKR